MPQPATIHSYYIYTMLKELSPNISLTESKRLDRKSVRLVKQILEDQNVDDSQLEEGGDLPNIDGRIELLREDRTTDGIVTVQIKHLTHPTMNNDTFYDIPQSLYAYAERRKGEVVLFMACDTDNNIVYWTHIDEAAIEDFRNSSDTHIQDTKRNHFKASETLTHDNAENTLNVWRKLYDAKMESIKDDRSMAERFAAIHLSTFKRLSNEFHGLPGSHIRRNETERIASWVKTPLKNNGSNVLLLTGNAGMGKSIVLKDLMERLEQENIKTLGIKADCLDETKKKITIESMLNAINMLSSGRRELLVVIIDQIDALSQYLTNDRNRLNVMLGVIATMNGRPGVRIIVSCRKYDLEYDAALNRLKDKSETVELGELSDTQVNDVLDRLDAGLKSTLSPRTATIIRTAQYLDTFCFVYSRNRTRVNYDNPIELYDALWQLYIDEAPEKISREDIEYVLFSLAKQVLVSGTLSPSWMPVSRYGDAGKYLCSSGAIRMNGGNMSFFHQTFYDYTLARCYVTENKSYIADLADRFQGIEIRSSVKSVLEYERGHSDRHYFNDLKFVFTSPQIRLHVKLLAVSVMAYSENPKPEEKRIFKQFCCNDTKLSAYFLRGVNSEGWFPMVRNLVRSIAKEMTTDNELYIPMLNSLSAYAYRHPAEIFGILNSIKDEKCRNNSIAYILRGHNDYNAACVRDAYLSVGTNDQHAVYFYLEDALLSAPEFTIGETARLVEKYLLSDNGRNSHNGYLLGEKLCKTLAGNHPMEYLMMFHVSFKKVLQQKSTPSCHKYKCNDIFNFRMDNYTETLLNLYRNLLLRYAADSNFIRPIVSELLSLNDGTSLQLAFEVMGHCPSGFHDEIKHILMNTDIAGDYVSHGDVSFFFLEMIRQWYLSADTQDALWYENYVLAFKSCNDTLFDKERRLGRLLMPYLCRDKWILICSTLPENTLLSEMKRCRQELYRRFRYKYENTRPKHRVTCANVCGGIASDEIYAKFSEKVWLNSFLKLKEHRHRYHDNRDLIDLRVHADAFRKCVEANIERFEPFVFALFAREGIARMYKVAGLKGLLDGGADKDEVWPLFKQISTMEFIYTEMHTYKELAAHYLKDENSHTDELVDFLVGIIKLPYEKSAHETYMPDDTEEPWHHKATEMLNRGINSPQGIALEIVISLCGIKSRRQQAYGLLTDLCRYIDNDLKAVVLQYLYTKECFDETLFYPLLKTCLDSMGVECLAIRAEAIQHCYYYKREFVEDYINQIEQAPQSHSVLAQIYFFGVCVKEIKEECAERLDAILNLNDEDVVEKIVEQALKNFSNTELNSCSQNVLRRFAADNRENIVNTYCLHCDSLPVEAFPFFCEISQTWYTHRKREVHYELEYVSKCISMFPRECLDFMKGHDFSNPDYPWIVDDDIVKILLQIYKKMNEDVDEEAMNELMDLFDDYIYRGNRIINNAMELIG